MLNDDAEVHVNNSKMTGKEVKEAFEFGGFVARSWLSPFDPECGCDQSVVGVQAGVLCVCAGRGQGVVRYGGTRDVDLSEQMVQGWCDVHKTQLSETLLCWI